MAEAYVEILGLDQLTAAIGLLAAGLVLRETMEVATELVRTELAVYPPPPAGYRMVWRSDKQRRFFFAALRAGRIEVPYRRTGTLGRRWTTRVRAVGNDLHGEVGNVTVYGPWVQADTAQAAVHRGRWRTDEMVARQTEPRVQALFEARIQAAMP